MYEVQNASINTLSPRVTRPLPVVDKQSNSTANQKRGKRHLTQVILTSVPLVVADLLTLIGSYLLANLFLGSLNSDTELKPVLSVLPYLAMASLIVFSIFGLYPGSGLSPIFELRQIAVALSMIFTVFLAAGLVLDDKNILAPMLIAAWLFSLPVVPILRSLFRRFSSRFPWWGQPVLIFGGHDAGILNYKYLSSRPYFGLRPVGIIDDLGLYSKENVQDPPKYLGTFEMAPSIVEKNNIFWAIFAMPERASSEVSRIIKEYVSLFPHALFVPEFDGLPSLWNRSFDLGRLHGICLESNLLLPLPRILKRAAELSTVIVATLFCIPLIAVIALLVKLGSPGPVFYGHERIGYNERRFKAWKFRTMYVNADQLLQKYLSTDPEIREEWEKDYKLKNDPRVTKIGRWLRKTSLDELPQLWNILLGEMSLVGPRPIVEAEIERYGESYELYKKVVPGLTGLWQVSGRNNTTYAERVRLDSYYVWNWSPWMDMYILGSTVKVVLRREGAY